MLNVEFIKNNPSNDWLVRQFEIFRFSGTSLADKFIPRPDISIVFHFKDCPLILGENNIQLEPLFIGPIIPKSIVLNFYGTLDTFIVICKPTVFSRVFNIDLSPVAKRSVDLPYHVFQPLWDNLAEIETTSNRVSFFTDFVNTFQPTPYVDDATDLLYNKIVERGANTLLKDIIQESSVCQRTLERSFIKRTGVTPKMLMRIVRINHLWKKINEDKVIDYQDLVFEGNFFDQAHFIKDFKSIIGETPNFFFNRNLQTSKMFSGREEGTMI